MTDSFAEHPISIAEARSSKTDLARDWSPRDVLVALLRDIDKGDLDIDAVVVFMRPRAKGGGFPFRCTYRVSSPDYYTTLGLVEAGRNRMADADRE